MHTFCVGKYTFDRSKKPAIMGILNVTPDSFSDGGNYNSLDHALKHAQQMIDEGADIIDIGGESTRPGFERVSDEDEIERVCPVIEAVKKNFDIPISLDTYKSKVAKEGLASGADMINDIWGLKFDPDLAGVIASAKASVCLMHNRDEAVYRNLMDDILTDLKGSVRIALGAGIAEEKICIDPGIGFAKDVNQNLQVLKEIERFHELDFPILLGVSRKSVIGKTLDLPVDQREEATVAITAFGAWMDCAIFRVHEVGHNRRAADMIYAIRNS